MAAAGAAAGAGSGSDGFDSAPSAGGGGGVSASQKAVFFPVLETVWKTASGCTLPFTVTFCSSKLMSNDSTPKNHLWKRSVSVQVRYFSEHVRQIMQLESEWDCLAIPNLDQNNTVSTMIRFYLNSMLHSPQEILRDLFSVYYRE